jgi:hypothetical protein
MHDERGMQTLVGCGSSSSTYVSIQPWNGIQLLLALLVACCLSLHDDGVVI